MNRQGIARLVADVVGGRSVLTEISHRSPARLHAMSNAASQRADAAWCTLGGFGGGVVGGDRTHIDVDVLLGAAAQVLEDRIPAASAGTAQRLGARAFPLPRATRRRLNAPAAH